MSKNPESCSKLTGRKGLSMAINYFTIKGYTISLPLNDTQWYDLVVEKDGIFKTIQCKATETKEGTIDFRSTGGRKGLEYDNIHNHKELDYLFCVNKDLKMWLIPLEDLKNSKTSIRLRTKPTANKQGFQSHLYMVDF